ncbi:MAG: hypothetical protein K2J84_04760, partial [Bacteroidaceae bacterium]|nr:hypothetical protein [Bacteroidaceae bacterium]
MLQNQKKMYHHRLVRDKPKENILFCHRQEGATWGTKHHHLRRASTASKSESPTSVGRSRGLRLVDVG